VAVVTIKPGFVDTPMTAGFRKGPLWASPEQVSKGIYRAILKKKNVIYLPWFWGFIMAGIRLVPERLFKKMRL
jgi:short-subunit dehydrogenase